jgi:hypothetical protein
MTIEATRTADKRKTERGEAGKSEYTIYATTATEPKQDRKQERYVKAS